MICVKTDEKMDVISDASGGSRFAPQPSNRATEIFVENPAPAGVDKGFAVLGAEDEVIMEREVSGAHRRWRVSGTPPGCILCTRLTGGIISLRDIQPPATDL